MERHFREAALVVVLANAQQLTCVDRNRIGPLVMTQDGGRMWSAMSSRGTESLVLLAHKLCQAIKRSDCHNEPDSIGQDLGRSRSRQLADQQTWRCSNPAAQKQKQILTIHQCIESMQVTACVTLVWKRRLATEDCLNFKLNVNGCSLACSFSRSANQFSSVWPPLHHIIHHMRWKPWYSIASNNGSVNKV